MIFTSYAIGYGSYGSVDEAMGSDPERRTQGGKF
jgi:hypothetical protein